MQGDVLRVRFRVDGVLREDRRYEQGEGRPLVARLKSMAHLDSGTLRLPRRGSLCLRQPEGAVTEGSRTDRRMRVQTYPFAEGWEAVEVRVPASDALSRLTDLGMTPVQAGECLRLLRRPHGILVVAGTRGSGRTTTLQTMLRELLAATPAGERSMVTIESPAERGPSKVSRRCRSMR